MGLLTPDGGNAGFLCGSRSADGWLAARSALVDRRTLRFVYETESRATIGPCTNPRSIRAEAG